MKRDIAAVVGVGAVQLSASGHRRQHFVGPGPGDAGHRRHEHAPMQPDGLGHASCRVMAKGIGGHALDQGLAQPRQFADKLRQ